jgi:hypothetical protein
VTRPSKLHAIPNVGASFVGRGSTVASRFLALHLRQATTRLLLSFVPPRDSGTTWSMVRSLPRVAGLPQYVHHGCSVFIRAAMRRCRVPVRFEMGMECSWHRVAPVTTLGQVG